MAIKLNDSTSRLVDDVKANALYPLETTLMA